MRTARSSATSITNADPGSRSITNVTTQSSHALVARITHSPQSIVVIPVAPRVVPLRKTIAGGCDTYRQPSMAGVDVQVYRRRTDSRVSELTATAPSSSDRRFTAASLDATTTGTVRGGAAASRTTTSSASSPA